MCWRVLVWADVCVLVCAWVCCRVCARVCMRVRLFVCDYAWMGANACGCVRLRVIACLCGCVVFAVW